MTRSPSPTPGCFSFFNRSSKSSKIIAQTPSTASSPFPSLAGSPSSYRPSATSNNHLQGDLYGCCCSEIPQVQESCGEEGLPTYGQLEEVFKPEVGRRRPTRLGSSLEPFLPPLLRSTGQEVSSKTGSEEVEENRDPVRGFYSFAVSPKLTTLSLPPSSDPEDHPINHRFLRQASSRSLSIHQ